MKGDTRSDRRNAFLQEVAWVCGCIAIIAAAGLVMGLGFIHRGE